jgi:hypothetical protein
MSQLRAPKLYTIDDDEAAAVMDLMAHLHAFNEKFGKRWSLTLPKRGRLGPAVGKCSDNNHLLYAAHVQAILEGCPKPLTVEGIRQKLVETGEKPSTAALLASDYFRLITKVLDPKTKLHLGAKKTLAEWGVP